MTSGTRSDNVMVTTDEVHAASAVLARHLQLADIENAIKEQKRGFGLQKLSTRNFHANLAYLLIGAVGVQSGDVV